MKKILSYFKKYWLWIFMVLVFLFVHAMCELALPNMMSDIINKGIITGDEGYIITQGVIMLAVSFFAMVSNCSAGYFASKTSAYACYNLRDDLFNKVTHFSTSNIEKFGSNSLITRSTNDIQTIQQSSIMVMRFAFLAPMMGVGGLIQAYNTKPSMTYVILLSLVAVLILMLAMFFMVMPKFKIVQEKLDQLNLVIGERLSGLLIVRAFNRQGHEEKRFAKANKTLMDINVFVNRGMALMFPTLMLIMNFTSIWILWVGAKKIDMSQMMVGQMLAFLQYTMQVIMSFLFITMSFIMIPRAAVSAKRVAEVIDTEVEIKDKNWAEDFEAHKGIVKFDHVSFKYSDAEEKTLSDISFTAMPGKTTAIIGGTGSGKSSLIQLIPRFFDATEGSVTIDGVDVRSMTQHSLREQIGYVPQKGFLFSGTIKSNLGYGLNQGANIKNFDFAPALNISMAEDFVGKLDDGLDTLVSQGGTSVSGGQKQRLAIARALARTDAKVLIFDDSFSALDYKTDKILRERLKGFTEDKTVIIVAQRINTILDADQIIVMDDGRIVAKGTHSELFRSSQVYREIALSQLSEAELKGFGEGENEIADSLSEVEAEVEVEIGSEAEFKAESEIDIKSNSVSNIEAKTETEASETAKHNSIEPTIEIENNKISKKGGR